MNNDQNYWVPTRLKREWVPEWLFRLFCNGSGIWLLDGSGNKEPWRSILMRPATEFEKRRFRMPTTEE